MRLDSRVLSGSVKFLVLGLIALSSTASVAWLGTTLESRLARPPYRNRHTRSLGLLAAASAIYGLLAAGEYVGVAHYHAQQYVKFWPIALTGGGLLGGLLWAVRSGRTEPIADFHGSRRASSWLGVTSLGCILALTWTVLLRADAASCVLRANTIVGRAYGLALSRFPMQLSRADTNIAAPLAQAVTNRKEKSNVVLITVDTLRADFLSVYDPAARPTPAIDGLARQGVLFDSVFAQHPTSAPSMATILTGTYPAHHGVRQNAYRLDESITTLAEILGQHGYTSAGFVTNINFAHDFGFDQGFDDYQYLQADRDVDRLITDSSDKDAVDQALAWLGQHSGDRIFLWVHLSAPHSPYLPPFSVPPGFSGVKASWFNVWNMPQHLARTKGLRTYFNRAKYLDLYSAEVSFADAQLKRLIGGLKLEGLFNSAQVIFTADHGEAFGEDDSFGHGSSLDPSATRVPLLWKLPDEAAASERRSTTLQLADITPSLLSMLGISRSLPADGRDVSALVTGEAKPDRGFAFTDAGYRGWLGRRGLKYAVRDSERTVWMDTGFGYKGQFDRRIDPRETKWSPLPPSSQGTLYRALEKLATQSEQQLQGANGPVSLSGAQEDRLRALGYLQ